LRLLPRWRSKISGGEPRRTAAISPNPASGQFQWPVVASVNARFERRGIRPLAASYCRWHPSRFFGRKSGANSNGGLCPGSGKAAANPVSRRKPRKAQAVQGKGVVSTDTSKSNSPSQTKKSVAAKQERPEMLLAKQATGVYPDRKSRMKGGDHWSFFQDNPRQDMETDGRCWVATCQVRNISRDGKRR
jgi:hypothetical protein